MTALDFAMNAFETSEYKALLDDAYASRDFDLLKHEVLEIDVDSPTVAVCSLFSVDHVSVGGDVLRIFLTVLPITATKTAVVFSHMADNAHQARGFLHRILTSRGYHQRYELSRLILDSCENLVLNPRYFEQWPEEKKTAVREYFVHTAVGGSELEYESQHLYVF